MRSSVLRAGRKVALLPFVASELPAAATAYLFLSSTLRRTQQASRTGTLLCVECL